MNLPFDLTTLDLPSLLLWGMVAVIAWVLLRVVFRVAKRVLRMGCMAVVLVGVLYLLAQIWNVA